MSRMAVLAGTALLLMLSMPSRAAALEPAAAWPAVYRVDTTDPVVFVTIDDGWTRSAAAHDELQRRGWPVTSFVVPEALASDPSYFETIGASSSFGTHTLHHWDMTKLSYAQQEAEICDGRDAISAIVGGTPGWLRVPYGSWNQTTVRAAQACGYPGFVLWDVTVDGSSIATTYGTIRRGDIILLHYTSNLAQGIVALGKVLDRLGLHPAKLADYLPPVEVAPPPPPPPPEVPIGTLDAVTLEPGVVRVWGWAIDPSTTGPVDVHVYIGAAGFALGPAARTRLDVALVHPAAGPDHGFDATIPWSAPGPVTVCAYAINVGPAAPNPGLGCRTVDVGAPFGALDLVAAVPGGIRVAGWAADPDTAVPIDVHVYVNGVGFVLGRADAGRADVGVVHPRYGPDHGYDAVVPWTDGGPLTVCSYGINVGPAAPNASVGCLSRSL